MHDCRPSECPVCVSSPRPRVPGCSTSLSPSRGSRGEGEGQRQGKNHLWLPRPALGHASHHITAQDEAQRGTARHGTAHTQQTTSPMRRRRRKLPVSILCNVCLCRPLSLPARMHLLKVSDVCFPELTGDSTLGRGSFANSDACMIFILLKPFYTSLRSDTT